MAVGRDNWNDLKSDNPIDSIKDTVFFQLVDFCFVQGLVSYLLSHAELQTRVANKLIHQKFSESQFFSHRVVD